MAPYSSTLAWKIPWTEKPGRLQSMGLQRVGHDWATFLSFLSFHDLKWKWKFLSRVQLFAIPWTVAYQASPSMGFSWQEYWSGCHFLLQRIFPTQGSNPGLPHCRQTLLPSEQPGKPSKENYNSKRCMYSSVHRSTIYISQDMGAT